MSYLITIKCHVLYRHSRCSVIYGKRVYTFCIFHTYSEGAKKYDFLEPLKYRDSLKKSTAYTCAVAPKRKIISWNDSPHRNIQLVSPSIFHIRRAERSYSSLSQFPESPCTQVPSRISLLSTPRLLSAENLLSSITDPVSFLSSPTTFNPEIPTFRCNHRQRTCNVDLNNDPSTRIIGDYRKLLPIHQKRL